MSGDAGAPGAAGAAGAAERPLKLAIFSPAPPSPSGIAAYLADLLPLLPERWSIDVVTEAGSAVAGSGVAASVESAPCADRSGRGRRLSYEQFRERQEAESYDLVIHQVGNSTERAAALAHAVQVPGLLVLHDGVLHPARVERAIRDGDIAAYRRAAVDCRGDVGRGLGHLVAGGLGGPAVYFTFPMCEDLVRASWVTAVHGEALSAWLRALVPGARVASLAHWRSVEGAAGPAGSPRRRRGAAGEVLIGCFGNIGVSRRVDRLLVALSALEIDTPWRLVVAGGVDPAAGLQELAVEVGIDDRVSWPGRLPSADFEAVMGAVDIAVNLRYPPARASSGVLHQLLQLGTPTIISDVVHWRDYPEAAVARVPPGPDDEEQRCLRSVLTEWISEPEKRLRVGEEAATWAAEAITPERMRDSYVAAVETALRAGRERTRPQPSVGPVA